MKMQQWIRAAFAIVAFLTLSAETCDDSLLEDPGFDLWCDGELCRWELEEGEVAQAPTWHRRDYGVELVGDPVAISQLSTATSSSVTCIRFEFLADIEETARVAVEMDFYDDGIVEFEQIVPTSRWSQISYRVTPPARFQAIRFRLRKTGSGRAVLAELVAEKGVDCADAPIDVSEHPDGASCRDSTDCLGVCPPLPSGPMLPVWEVCGQCVDDADCPDDQACGLEVPEYELYDLYRACGAPARHSLGEACVTDAECATGSCFDHRCVACTGDADCPDDRICGFRDASAVFPYQCSPGAGLGASGEHCLADDDCASGECAGQGTLKVCSTDRRPCQTAADCPLSSPYVLLVDDDPDRTCDAVGVRHGVCQ